MRSTPGSRSMRSTVPVRARLVGVAMAVAVLAIGCGGDDEPGLEVTDDTTIEPADSASATDVTDADTASAGADDTTSGDTGTATADTATDTADTAADTATATATAADGDATFPTPAAVSGDPAFTDDSKLTTVGLDEVFFGDTPRDAAQKVGTDWIGLPPQGTRPQCFTIQPTGGPPGTVFTVLDGRIERVDLTSPDITTRSGLGVGSTEDDIVELFGGSIEIAAVTGGNEIIFVPTDEVDRDFRIIWTTDGTTVTAMRAGRVPGVLAAAPCA